MKKTYNIIELFSGIGSQAKALNNIEMDINIVATCEWNIHALSAYNAIHTKTQMPQYIKEMSREELLKMFDQYTLSSDGKTKISQNTINRISDEALKYIFFAIENNKNVVDINTFKGTEIKERVDIMTYSFPCQDLSKMGCIHGYNGGIDKERQTRSSLLWQVGRILNEMRTNNIQLPKFLVMENVQTLLSDRHIENFQKWQKELNELGYFNAFYKLNAKNFGTPQSRPRLIMFSVLINDDEELRKVTNFFANKTPNDISEQYIESKYYKKYEIKDMLRLNYKDKQLLQEAIDVTPNNTPSRKKIWQNNPTLVLPDGTINQNINYIPTITTTQDRNPNSGNIYFENSIENKGCFRYLTPRECFLFMGFEEQDFENIISQNIYNKDGKPFFSRIVLSKMAGNSIPVKLLEGVFLQIKMLDDLLSNQ